MSSLAKEVKEQIAAMDAAMKEVDNFYKPILEEVDYDELTQMLDSEDRARYDLTILYAVNSLFWMLKRSYGEDPQNHGIKGEIDRIKERMLRLKEINDKAKMPRVDKQGAERVIRHGLNVPKKRLKTVKEENWENEKMEEDTGQG